MFDDKIASQIPCSDTDWGKQNCANGADVTDQVVEEIEPANMFVLQLDGGTEISDKTQLVTFIRVPDEVETVKRILLSRVLKGRATVKATILEINSDCFNEQTKCQTAVA
jgi:hypothetical protein